MPYTTLFGGQPIYSAQPSYLALPLTIANTSLEWPLETADGVSVLATIIDATPDAPARVIILPDARNGSNGAAITFSNLAADTYTVKDNAGNVVLTVASGLVWTLYLRSNATIAGVWRAFQQGAGSSAANAASLAGAGLKAITTTLNTKLLPTSHGVNYALVDADRATVQTWTGGIGAFTLPMPATVGPDWYAAIKNNGSGALTVSAASGNVDGDASLVLNPDESAFFYTDGANFFTLGRGQEINSVFDFTSISAAGTGTLTLSGVQLNRIAYQFTGILTGNRTIVVPNTTQQYWVANDTTGAFTLTVKTAAGAGVIVPQGTRVILYCDGASVLDATTGITAVVRLLNGAVGAPALSWDSEPSSGLYRNAAGDFRYSVGGADVVQLVAGAFRTVDGVVGTPSHSFIADPDTGLFRPGANMLAVAVGGLTVGTFLPNGNGQLGMNDGTAANPAYSFSGDTDVGIYRSAVNEMGLVTGGANALLIDASQRVRFVDGLVGTPSVTFQNDTDTGLYRVAANDMAFVTGGGIRLEITATTIVSLLPILNQDGGAGNPAYTFSADPDTGLYRVAANDMALVTGGAIRMEITATTIVSSLPVLNQNGAVGAPAYSFSSDPNTGLYRIAASRLGLSVNGVVAIDITTTTVTLTSPLLAASGGAGGPGYSFSADPNTGLYSSGADEVTVSTGGVNAVIFDSGQHARFTDGTAGSPAITYQLDTDTGFYRDTANQIAIALGGVTAGQIAQGTFTGTLTGFTANPTGTVNWQRVGKVVHMWVTAAIQATSNTANMTMTGMPAIITPGTGTEAMCSAVDSTGTLMCQANISSGGVITFFLFRTGTVANRVDAQTGLFTASGTKGITNSWNLTFTVT